MFSKMLTSSPTSEMYIEYNKDQSGPSVGTIHEVADRLYALFGDRINLHSLDTRPKFRSEDSTRNTTLQFEAIRPHLKKFPLFKDHLREQSTVYHSFEAVHGKKGMGYALPLIVDANIVDIIQRKKDTDLIFLVGNGHREVVVSTLQHHHNLKYEGAGLF